MLNPPAKFWFDRPRDHGPRPSGWTRTGPRPPGRGPALDLTRPARTKPGAFSNFCFLKFSGKRTVRAARTLGSTSGPAPPGGWGPAGPNIAYDAFGAGLHLCAKFRHGRTDGAAAYSEQTNKHTNTQVYIAKYIID